MKKSAFIYIVLAGVLWGTSGIFVNLMSPYGFSPVQMTCMRSLVSALCMGGYLLLKDKSCFRVPLKQFLMFLISGAAVFGTATFYYAAIGASSVSTAVVLMYTAPVFVTAYSVAFLSERFSLSKGTAVVLMIVGCALVSGLVGGAKFSFMGTLLGLCSGISYSIYNIATKIQMIKGCKPLSATFYSFTVMAVISLCVCKPWQIVDIAMDEPLFLFPMMIGIGVFTCVLPYLLYTLGMKEIPAGTASALGIVEPMSATVFSVVIFGEKLSITSLIGIVLILVSVFLLSRTEE